MVNLLEPGGELVAITPRSFCNGPYFKPFRKLFLKEMTLSRIHVFESRDEAFGADEVLQENIIFHAIKNGEISLVINTPFGRETRSDGYHIRTAASNHRVSSITTIPAAQTIVQALEAVSDGDRLEIYALQDFDQWVPPKGAD